MPGLGHWYQGRRAKAVLYFVAIVGLFGWGIYLGGSDKPFDRDGTTVSIGYGRAVYFAWRPDDHRLYYVAQVFVGLPALPAFYQAHRMEQGLPVVGEDYGPAIAGNWRAAEPERQERYNQPTADELNKRLNRYFDLATFYARSPAC